MNPTSVSEPAAEQRPSRTFFAIDAVLTFVVWLLSLLFYRVRVFGQENIPESGGALLICNHISWADGVLLQVHIKRPIRLVAYSENIRGPFLKWMAKTMRVIPINAASGPKNLVRTLRTANQAIQDGDLLCLFPEGSLTRIGQLLPFQRGMIRMVEGTGAPIVPMYLEGLWGSVFSFIDGKFFWKFPRRWPYRVDLHIGRPIADPKDPFEIRQEVERLGVQAALARKDREKTLPRHFLRQCRRSLFRSKVADSMGQDMTGGQVLLRTLILKRLLEREVLAPDEKMVGVLLPPSAGGVLANMALPLLQRVPVNLNYTFTSTDLNAHIKACHIKHVLTSKRFMEKMEFKLDAELVYLDEFKDKVTTADKLISALQAYVVPAFILERILGITSIRPDDTLTVIFTSGSTGEAKGVVLSYYNVFSNVEAIDHLFNLKPKDVVLGVLPFFHSFGFTATMWAVMGLKCKGIYHFNPLDARVIGKLCADHKLTILMTTPTFLRTYLKRCDKEQLQTAYLVVTGAEKLPADLADAFEEKFGVRPKQGYGTTELSPLVSVNIFDYVAPHFSHIGNKEGSVGRPVPGVAVKIADPDTGAELGADQPGLLLVSGPNVMQGYLNWPEKTAEVMRDGWYVTGDIAKVDQDGFIFITDRQSRFSKIGGEMVPHLKIEELLTKILAQPEDEGPELRAVVTSVPDSKKGERLVVVHKPLSKPVDQICRELADAGLPNIWIPSPDSFMEVEEIPVLGTGKLDLKGLKNKALEKFAKA